MGKNKFIVVALIAILFGTTTFLIFSLQTLQNEVNYLKEQNTQLENKNLQQQQDLTEILADLPNLERKKEWHHIDVFKLGGNYISYEQGGDYPEYRLLRVKWNTTTALNYLENPAFLVTSGDGTLLLLYMIIVAPYQKGVFYFQTLDGSFIISTLNVENTITCVLEEYRS